MGVFVKKDPWLAITPAVAGARGRVVAAIAYVNEGAHRLLPLKEGDVLVCDASRKTVKSGGTDPKWLQPFLDEGVNVWSFPGLHAKVVVLPRRAFVGSANASNHSAGDLFEAAIDTVERDEVIELRKFVLDLRGVPIDRRAIRELSKLVPKHTGPLPIAVDPGLLPEHIARLAIVSYRDGDIRPSTVKVIKRGDRVGRELASREGTGFRVEPSELKKVDLQHVRVGDWVTTVTVGVAESPGLVVHIESYGQGHAAWLARPKCTVSKLSNKKREAANIPDQHEVKVLRGAEAQRVLNLFR